MVAQVPELPAEGKLLPNEHLLPVVSLLRYKLLWCLSHHKKNK